ncbi:MAG TPA: 2-amino-4-hydroxy-6-hydroxymethyldihydropteridine diphosphokinase [Clostridiaceae bacterium]|nr:2-amino-4-hydroxy-6-hydroxymethyldihydropteridine diphosphokinase [Clostridiaceae bacterium]
MYKNVYIALGSNLGDRERNLSEALECIGRIPGTRIVKASDIYETDPVGYTEQGKFLNMVVSVETGLEPRDMLKELQDIENLLKRDRVLKWGPRTIDLDILLYDDLTVSSENLTIPHPRMFERAFVLVPLKDVWNGDAEKLDVFIEKCSDRDGVRRFTGLRG